MTESKIQHAILHALNRRSDVRVFRNNVGTAVTQDGRFIRFGLQPGSADLIGWKSVVITNEDVGKKLAVFVSVEIKKPGGRVRPEQENWMRNVIQAGGLAIISRDPSDITF